MYLTTERLDPQSLAAEVMRASDGACVTFDGVVRDRHEGKAVESIHYEAYESMAEKEIAAIVDAVRNRFPDVALTLRHRLGLLRVGESSIVIVSAAPHRAEAFEACRMAIDEIKKTVPIWKKERGPDGEEWVGWAR